MSRIPIETEVQENDPFSQFTEKFKDPEDGVEYKELQDYTIRFDSKDIQLLDPHNLEQLIIELNNIPRTLFRYRMIMDTQTKLVQQLEDEYERWHAEKWVEIDKQTEPKYDKAGNYIGETKIVRTEGAKDKLILTMFPEESKEYQKKLRDEKYRLSLVKSTVAAIDNYSYKLHSILTYKQMLESKGIR